MNCKWARLGLVVSACAGKRRRAAAAALAVALSLCAGAAIAQNATNGRILYNTPLVVNEKSCGAGSCHGPDPLQRQNRIQNGDTPGGIGLAISRVSQMAFLRGNTTGAQLADLAAYIADPASASGPVASLSTPSLSFAPTVVGASSAAQAITLTNTGNLAMAIGAVSASNTDFSITSNTCASTLAAAASCVISVAFTPKQGGARSGEISVLHDAPGSPSTVVLEGSGIGVGTLAISVPALSFPGYSIGQASTRERAILTNVGGSPVSLASFSELPSSFLLRGSSCVVGLSLAPGASCEIGVVFVPRSVGDTRARLVIGHSGQSGITELALEGRGVALPADTRLMVEYFFAPLGYYFITSRSNEQEGIDTLPAFADFERTGETFLVYATQSVGSEGIARFYFDQIARNRTRGSHFYTLIPGEKQGLIGLNPSNQFLPRVPFYEGIDSYAQLPNGSGASASCPAGLQPIYRLFRGNVRFPDDPNHRFTPNRNLYLSFVAAGWDDEGIAFCVPQ